MKKGILSTIEITDSHVKFFQAKLIHGKRVVCACDVRKFHHYTDEELVNVLTAMTHSKSIDNALLIVQIPRRFIMMKRMRLPSVQDAEIRKMIALQLVNQIPYSVEDVILDYCLIETETSGYVKVIVAIVHKDVVQRYLKIFKDVGLCPCALRFSSMGVLDWLNFQILKKRIDKKCSIALVNIDMVNSEICFSFSGKLFFSRNINYGVKDLNEDNFIVMIDQIVLSFKTYQKEDMGPEIGKIIIVSLIAGLDKLKEQLEKALKVPVEIFSPLEGISCQRNLNLGHLKGNEGVSLTAGLGVLFSEKKEQINLMPKEFYISEKAKIKKRQVLKFFFLFFVTCIFAASVLRLETHSKEVILNTAKEDVMKTRKRVEQAEEKMKVFEVFKEEQKSRISIVDLMLELSRLTPEEISFRSLLLDDKGEFIIRGYAKTNISIKTFRSNLLTSAMFKDVNQKQATGRKVSNMEIINFEIVTQLSSRGKE